MNGASGPTAYRSEDEFEDFAASTRQTGPTGIGIAQPKVDHPSYPYTATSSSTSQALTGAHRPGGSGNMCCLLDVGHRCQRTAGNASYSKRVQKTVFYKRLRLDVDNTAQHTYICDHHKNMIQTARVRVKKERDSDDEVPENPQEESLPDVDLYQLQVTTLRRYKKHFKISTRPGLNKAQLADILTKHFKTIPVNEKEIITYFIYAVKSGRNKVDNPSASQASGSTIVKEEYLDRY